uniref:Uncharacterized protein n=1 Tax=Anguilla anguilla TaxID=7936 RepID=A0A0E9WF62_ANGAN
MSGAIVKLAVIDSLQPIKNGPSTAELQLDLISESQMAMIAPPILQDWFHSHFWLCIHTLESVL